MSDLLRRRKWRVRVHDVNTPIIIEWSDLNGKRIVTETSAVEILRRLYRHDRIFDRVAGSESVADVTLEDLSDG